MRAAPRDRARPSYFAPQATRCRARADFVKGRADVEAKIAEGNERKQRFVTQDSMPESRGITKELSFGKRLPLRERRRSPDRVRTFTRRSLAVL